jgi:hypothetical protein
MNTRAVDIAMTSLHRPIATTSGTIDSTVAEPGGPAQLTSQAVTGHNAERAFTRVHICNSLSVTGHIIFSIVYVHPNSHILTKIPYKFPICTTLTTRPPYSNDLHFPILTTQGDTA